MKAELVGEHFKAMMEIEEEATILYNKLKPIRDQLIKGAMELEALNEKHIGHMKQIDRTHLNREDQLYYGIAESREMDGQKLISGETQRRKVMVMLNSLKFKPFVDRE